MSFASARGTARFSAALAPWLAALWAAVMGFSPAASAQNAAPPTADAPAPLQMASFGGISNLPVWVAQDKGFFAANGVAVSLARVKTTATQMTDVMAGKYPLFITAMDNIVAYQEGQGAVALPEQPDLFAFMGVHHGLNSLVVDPSLMTYQDLRGRTLGVDSLTSGYAFVLYRLLERNDLQRGVDYQVVALGAPASRFAALKERRIDGTLLAIPNDDEARELGFTVLAEPADLAGGYQGSVYGSRRSWANAHPREMAGIVRGLIEAHGYIRADKAGAIAVLRAHIHGLGAERAALAYSGLVEEKGGLSKHGGISIGGVKTVLRLRSEMSEPQKSLSDPYRYVDTSYYKAAIGK